MKNADDIIAMIGNTSGSRFHCSRRLKAKDRFNNGVIFIASAIAILISIAPTQIVMDDAVRTYLTLLSLSLSVLILALSGIQYGSNLAVQSELMHKCALDINEVRRKLEAKENPSGKFVQDCLSQYDMILQKYPMNHETVDFLTFKLEHHWRFPELNHILSDRVTGQPIVTERRAVWNRLKLRFEIFWTKRRGLLGAGVGITVLLIAAFEYV
jgi:hypothetical protein